MSVSTFSRSDWMPGVTLHRAATALEAKGTGHDRDRERTEAARNLRDDRRATGAGAATLARGDEHHVGALEDFLDLVAVVLGGLSTHFRVGAGTEPTSELAADVELDVGIAHEQRLGVGVDRDELAPLESGLDHAVDGVATAAADAGDLDHGEVVLRLSQHHLISSFPWVSLDGFPRTAPRIG